MEREQNDRWPHEREGLGECAADQDVEGEVGRGQIDHGGGEARGLAPPLADEPERADPGQPHAQEEEQIEGRRVDQPEVVQADEEVGGERAVVIEVGEAISVRHDGRPTAQEMSRLDELIECDGFRDMEKAVVRTDHFRAEQWLGGEKRKTQQGEVGQEGTEAGHGARV